METATRYCYRHPDRETGLSCSECDRPICYECMTPAPVGLRCPEHSGKPQGVKKVTAAAGRVASGGASRRGTPVTIALIALNVGVYLAELASGGDQDGIGSTIFTHGVLYGPWVSSGDWWRLITAPFLHFGIIHLGLNMLGLYWLGRVLETVIGSWRYALLYVASGLAGSAGALWLTPNAFTAGASGAIFGVLGALLVLERRGLIQSGGQIMVLLIFNLIFTFSISGISLATGSVGISLGGHLGGLAGGIVVMYLYLEAKRSVPLCIAAAFAVSAVSVAIAYAVI